MTTYIANFDYEYCLRKNVITSNDSISEKLNYELEYLLLFCLDSKDVLATHSLGNYSKDYLSYACSYFSIPEIRLRKSGEINWWGELKDIEKERKINSKEFAAIFHKDYGKYSNFFKIVSNKDEILEYVKESDFSGFVLKESLNMSGRGNYVFFKDKIIPSEFEFNNENFSKDRKILMPWLNRSLDLGLRISNEGIERVTINDIDVRGGFKGALYFLNPEEGDIFLNENFKFNINLYREFYRILWKYYENEGALGSLQVDAFLYEKVSHSCFLPMVEVNYRKTMGDVLKIISNKLVEKGVTKLIIDVSAAQSGILLIDRVKNSKLAFNHRLNEGVIILTPDDLPRQRKRSFKIFIVIAETYPRLVELESQLKNLISSI